MYKILSKQNFGVALTLILTILLSQSNIMNLLFDTILGRTILVLILLCISCTNQILGAVSTLFAIMLFACSYNYTENFEATIAPDTITPDTIAPAIIAPDSITPDSIAPDSIAPDSIALDSITPTPLDNTETDMLDNNKYIVTEGFDILGTEQNLQRGKKSNTIMVNEDMRKSENVDPYDGGAIFTCIS